MADNPKAKDTADRFFLAFFKFMAWVLAVIIFIGIVIRYGAPPT